MKKTLIAALALVAMVGCSKENSEATINDPTAPVAASFTSAAISRVADDAWEENNKIGITMVQTGLHELADGDYENVPYTVKEASASGTFSADNTVVYFPVDETEVVDFIAYYPYTVDADVDSDKNIKISVADQEYEHIDLVAAKAQYKTKSSPTVAFTDNSTLGGENEAFLHQLSKLTMNIVAGDGIDALTDIVATIKGQYTTAKFNIYSFDIIADETDNITAITKNVTAAEGTTTPAKATIEAILIPASEIAGSTIEFAVGGNIYYLDTKDFVFTTGCEHTYTITLKRTGAEISGAEISKWGTGDVIDSGELDASDLK